MLTTKEKITNQLLATIYTDIKDKTIFHINMDNALKILIGNGLILPKKQYEAHLENLLNKKLVGTKASQITKVAISELMYNLAIEIALSKEEIIKYELMNQQNSDIHMTD